jgi:cob(I)alamin adenosyltransferase
VESECQKTTLQFVRVGMSNSQIGVALSLQASADSPAVSRVLESVQRQLFVVGSELANSLSEKPCKVGVEQADITDLEDAIDSVGEVLPVLEAFVLPGGCPQAAALHLARSICRRAERRVVELVQIGDCQSELGRVVVYLNRLSDFLFVAARRVNHDNGVEETKWLPSEK